MSLVASWSSGHESRYVCISNVHSVVTARCDPSFASVLSGADLVTPDGAPVAWMLRKQGFVHQERINGPDLMWRSCSYLAEKKQSIYLYGGSEQTLQLLVQKLKMSFPRLTIAGTYSPPFRDLTADENAKIVRNINESGAGVVWVGLGCPKQERWMAARRGEINAVMIGVGAAFDYHAGTLKRAPRWMQDSGLEWAHRLASEPRRLWKRYLVSNSVFLWHAAGQLCVGNRRQKK